jgi:hypothetical protein
MIFALSVEGADDTDRFGHLGGDPVKGEK